MIRKYQSSDHNAVLQLMAEFYSSSAVLHPVPLSHLEGTLHQVEANSPYIDMLVVEHNQQAVGYMQLSLTHSTESGGLVVLLEELYISNNYQGRGLGKQALQYMLDNYTHASRFRLEVCATNVGAVSLYKRMGFSQLHYDQYILENN